MLLAHMMFFYHNLPITKLFGVKIIKCSCCSLTVNFLRRDNVFLNAKSLCVTALLKRMKRTKSK